MVSSVWLTNCNSVRLILIFVVHCVDIADFYIKCHKVMTPLRIEAMPVVQLLLNSVELMDFPCDIFDSGQMDSGLYNCSLDLIHI